MDQLSLFDVQAVYASSDDELSNDELYKRLSERLGIPEQAFDEKQPVGEAGAPVSLLKRKVRWFQQTLKSMGVIERIENSRGVWRKAGNRHSELTENLGKVSVVAFSTDLGCAIWGLCNPTFKGLDCPITLCLTSPPYPLRCSRAYGNLRDEQAYIDFVCNSLEPIVENLRDGGSICLNIGQDIFLPKSPARSLYCERLVLALHDRLGLSLMDRLIWQNKCKPPAPIQWASKKRVQLNVQYEPIYWFTNNPETVLSDNRRVLQPHTEKHKRYLQSGKRKPAINSDGAYIIRETSYKNETAGRIPRNILDFPHNCPDQKRYKQFAREMGLPAHGAAFPLEMAKFLIQFLSSVGDLVVDGMAGSLTTGKASEELGRRWLVSDAMLEYLIGGSSRFSHCQGFNVNKQLLSVAGFG